jgi:hypothetical protein
MRLLHQVARGVSPWKEDSVPGLQADPGGAGEESLVIAATQ